MNFIHNTSLNLQPFFKKIETLFFLSKCYFLYVLVFQSVEKNIISFNSKGREKGYSIFLYLFA